MEKQNKIVFLLVNYFNEKEVAGFVASELAGQLNEHVCIVIADNGSQDKKVLQKIEGTSVKLIEAGTNRGYFGAASLGLQWYLKEKGVHPDAVIICNTDISLESTDFIKQLNTYINVNAFDVMGPDIYSTAMNYHQNPYIESRISGEKIERYKRVTSNSFLYWMYTLLHLIKTKLVRANKRAGWEKQMNPYAVHGSFMVFNRSFFEKGGSINYPSLLFGEELFVAEQVRKFNMKMVYEPLLVICHHEHTTTGTFKSKQAVKYLHQSYCYLADTFFK